MEGSLLSETALVTGASSGIGLAISKTLHEMGYAVIGIGRSFDGGEDVFARKIEADLLDTDNTVSLIKDILKDNNVTVLVNSMGVAYYGLHENISPDQISAIIRTDLELPLVISSAAVDSFKKKGKGYIFNISSVTAENVNTHGAAYGAAKAGLTSFSRSLHEEVRKHNIKVTDIRPDMTMTDLYRNADFTCSDDPGAYLEPEDVAQVVKFCLSAGKGRVITEIKIEPQLRRIKKK